MRRCEPACSPPPKTACAMAASVDVPLCLSTEADAWWCASFRHSLICGSASIASVQSCEGCAEPASHWTRRLGGGSFHVLEAISASLGAVSR
eukprot:scaffold257505_cov24-Tisochrysis_lutea.AAC.1